VTGVTRQESRLPRQDHVGSHGIASHPAPTATRCIGPKSLFCTDRPGPHTAQARGARAAPWPGPGAPGPQSRYAESLCRVAMPSRYAESLCRVAVPSRYAESLCRVAMPSRYAESLCRVALPSRTVQAPDPLAVPANGSGAVNASALKDGLHRRHCTTRTSTGTRLLLARDCDGPARPGPDTARTGRAALGPAGVWSGRS
jgi:hypothetical protein